jgi:hypothetical protein
MDVEEEKLPLCRPELVRQDAQEYEKKDKVKISGRDLTIEVDCSCTLTWKNHFDKNNYLMSELPLVYESEDVMIENARQAAELELLRRDEEKAKQDALDQARLAALPRETIPDDYKECENNEERRLWVKRYKDQYWSNILIDHTWIHDICDLCEVDSIVTICDKCEIALCRECRNAVGGEGCVNCLV